MTIAEAWKGLECVDLSVPLSAQYPVTWPTLPHFRKQVANWFEDIQLPNGERLPSGGYYYAQFLELDEHTGTHVDFPLHIFPQAELKRQGVNLDPPLESFVGPAVTLDARTYLDQAPRGRSPRIPAELVRAWEKEHGEIQPGEIVLMDTGYTDRYFRPLPEGDRMIREVLFSGKFPGWPVPAEEVMELLGDRGVRHVGISSPSMGALDDSQGPHEAGVRRGMTYAETLIHLDRLPARGAFYVGLPLKIGEQSGSPIRAVAFIKKPGGQPCA
jgi:isatin hydrolase